MNKVLKITNKEAYKDQWNHRMKPCLFLAWNYQEDQLIHLVGRGWSNTGSDVLYIKKMLKVWDIAEMKNLTASHNIGSSLGRNLCS